MRATPTGFAEVGSPVTVRIAGSPPHESVQNATLSTVGLGTLAVSGVLGGLFLASFISPIVT